MAWNGSKGASAPKVTSKKSPASPLRGALALLVVVALGALAYLLVSRPVKRPTQPAEKESSKAIAAATSEGALPEFVRDAVVRAPAAADPVSAAEADASLDQSEAEVAPPNPPKKIFKNGTDQLIWLTVFASNGASIPPLPHISDADTDRFVESLRKEIEFEDDDPEHIREMKMAVNDVRKQIAGLIAQNPDVGLGEILRMHRDEFNTNLDLRTKAREGYDALVEEGDHEGAEAYLEKANELLSQYGADPIEIEEDEEMINE